MFHFRKPTAGPNTMVDREIPIEVIGAIEEVTDVISLPPHVDIHQLAEQLTRQGGKFKLKEIAKHNGGHK